MMTRISLLVLLFAPTLAVGQPTPELLEVSLLSSLQSERVPTPHSKLASARDPATLHVAVKVRLPSGDQWVGGIETFRKRRRGRLISVHPLPHALGALRVSWRRLEPDVAGAWFDNTKPSYHYEPIPYRATAIDGSDGRLSIPADPTPTLLPAGPPGVGTMRYQVVVRLGSQVLESPGLESRAIGGLSAAVHRISYRGTRTNEYVNTLLAFFNQPYIWGSMGRRASKHQAEHFVGADCADLLTAAYRLWSGRDVPYHYTGGFAPGGRYRSWGKGRTGPLVRGEAGVYWDEMGKAVAVGQGERVQVGDVIRMTRHVGVLSRDTPPLGVLDASDLIIHTLFQEPREEAALQQFETLEGVFRWRPAARERR